MPSLFRGFLSVAAAGAVWATLAAPASAQTSFSDAQKAEIGQIIKSYLLQNPEVLQEAIGELEKRQAAAQRVAQQEALSQSEALLNSSPNGNLVGNPAGDVTLIEFFDYNCGYCKRALSDMRSLMKTDPKLRVILRDLPVLGPDSVEAARVALAVKMQISGDKLFEYHSRLLDSRGRVGAERAMAVAKEMGLDLARVTRDVNSPEVAAALAEDAALSEKLSLSGTPAFIVGDEVISGAVGLEPLRQAIAMTRKCGKATC